MSDVRALVTAVLADPPRRQVLASLPGFGSRPAPKGPVPTDPGDRWARGHGVGHLLAALQQIDARELERLAFTLCLDAFEPGEAQISPADVTPFHALEEIADTVRWMVSTGHTIPEVRKVIASLRQLWEYVEAGRPATWRAVDVGEGCGAMIDAGAPANRVGEMFMAARALWLSIGRPDRIDAFAEFVRGIANR